MHTALSIQTNKLQHLDSSKQFYLLNSEAKLKDFTNRAVIVERERERKGLLQVVLQLTKNQTKRGTCTFSVMTLQLTKNNHGPKWVGMP